MAASRVSSRQPPFMPALLLAKPLELRASTYFRPWDWYSRSSSEPCVSLCRSRPALRVHWPGGYTCDIRCRLCVCIHVGCYMVDRNTRGWRRDSEWVRQILRANRSLFILSCQLLDLILWFWQCSRSFALVQQNSYYCYFNNESKSLDNGYRLGVERKCCDNHCLPKVIVGDLSILILDFSIRRDDMSSRRKIEISKALNVSQYCSWSFN